ncbi:sigma-70 family RNA polymerase sigma factor [bacterium]|nr:sigma-70 family RNA polymerase sigma factor [bacterium]
MEHWTSYTRSMKEGKALELYLREIGRIPLINKEEEIRLAILVQEGDRSAEKRLIEGNLRFVVSIAKKFNSQRLSLLDLINEGNLGLIEATKHFNPDRGVRFVTYAVWWIRQAILQAISLHGYVVKLPLKRANLRQRIKQNEHELRHELGRTPDIGEIADSLDEDEIQIENVLRASRVCISLEVMTQEDENRNYRIMTRMYNSFDEPDQMISRIMASELRSLLHRLSRREIEVIYLHYGLQSGSPRMTLEEIGQKLGITKEGVRQIEKKALTKLKTSCEIMAEIPA